MTTSVSPGAVVDTRARNEEIGRAFLAPPDPFRPALVVVATRRQSSPQVLTELATAAFADARAMRVKAARTERPGQGERWQAWYRGLGDEAGSVRCVVGDDANHLLPLAAGPARGLGLVRDPVDYVVAYHRAAVRPVPLKALLAEPETAGDAYCNPQSRALLAPYFDVTALARTPGPPPDADVWRQRLHEAVDAHYTLGSVEDIIAYNELLNRKFAWWSAALTRRDPRLAAAGEYVSAATAELVRSANWLDQELHERVATRYRGPGWRPFAGRGGARTTVHFSHDDEDRPTLVFHHIRKTGGTSLKDIIDANLADAERRDIYVPEDPRPEHVREWWTTWLEELTEVERRRLRCVAGHSTAGLGSLLPRAEMFCVIRNPVDRVLSRYWFTAKREESVPPRSILAWPLEQIFERLGGGHTGDTKRHAAGSQFFNGQARLLLENRHDVSELAFSEAPGPDADRWRARLFEIVDEQYLAGVTEQFDAFVAELERRYGWRRPEVEPQKVNRSRPRAKDLPEELIAVIRSYNWLDAELHAHVAERWRAA